MPCYHFRWCLPAADAFFAIWKSARCVIIIIISLLLLISITMMRYARCRDARYAPLMMMFYAIDAATPWYATPADYYWWYWLFFFFFHIFFFFFFFDAIDACDADRLCRRCSMLITFSIIHMPIRCRYFDYYAAWYFRCALRCLITPCLYVWCHDATMMMSMMPDYSMMIRADAWYADDVHAIFD